MTSAISAVAIGLTRRFWIVSAACVLACAAFAAQAAGHLVEARYLEDRATAPTVPVMARAAAPPATPRAGGASSDALVARNMFCSDCGPEAAPVPEVAGAEVPITSLPLVLVATSLGGEPMATIRDERSGSQGAYVVSDLLRGGGAIQRIAGTFVEFHNDATARTEKILLLGLAPVVARADAPAIAASPASPFADRVRKIDDTHFAVERGLIRTLVSSGGKDAGARIMPLTKDGKLAGMKVVGVRADSVALAMGLRNGDSLTAINGIALDSPDKLLEAYAKLDDASRVELEGTRGGKPLTLDYQLQ